MQENKISQTAEPANAPLKRPANPTHRILVVEDHVVIRHVNTRVLIDGGYQVEAAEDGAVAWENLQAKRYHLMITDNDMPKVSGFDLLRKVHAARLDLPVIMATGIVPKDEFDQFPWIRPTAMLLKPYTVGELLKAVKTILSPA